jgi:hypothetical protein
MKLILFSMIFILATSCKPSQKDSESATNPTVNSVVEELRYSAKKPPKTCSSFTYSAYGICQANKTQTRVVLSRLPLGCIGGNPVTSQACATPPPAVTCTSFTYSAYGACQSNNTQTRNVLAKLPTGCSGGSPVTSKTCTYVPPVIAPSGCYISTALAGTVMKTTESKTLSVNCTQGNNLKYTWKEGTTTKGTAASLLLSNPTLGTHSYTVTVSNSASSKNVIQTIVVNSATTDYVPSPSPLDKIWVGPRALETTIGSSGHHNILSDYHEIYDLPNNWSEVASSSQVFDLFQEALMVMKLDNPNGMNSLAQSLKSRGLKVNIETGGLRASASEQCGAASANEEFQNEKAIFSYWKSMAGGRAPLDYLTTDNAFFFSMNKRYGGANPCKLSLSQLVDLYIDNAVKMKAAFPGISIGITEGLGAFNLIGLDGTNYRSTDPTNINLNFDELIRLITTKASQRGISIDYFVVDYADSVTFDAGQYPGSHYITGGNDYGRILGAEAIAKKYGMRVGLFPNWFNATSASDAKNKSMTYRRQYAQMGGKADFYNFEFWQSLPDKLGVETDGQSNVWNTIRDLIRDLKSNANPTCTNLNFIGGGISTSSVNAGGEFTLACNYGIVDSFIYPKALGSQCSFIGTSGSVANFKCIAPMTPGNYPVACYHAQNLAANTCSQNNPIGSITVTNSCTNIPFKGGDVSARTVTTSGTFSMSCDYGQLDNITYPSVQGGTCQFVGSSGTAARFNCSVSANPGTYAVGCIHAADLANNHCAQNNSLGYINVE